MKNNAQVYFDHQASTYVDDRVLDKMLPYFREKYGNPHSADHAVGWECSQTIANARAQVAAMLGCDPDEVIFTAGATEANNLALLGLAGGKRSEPRRNRILVSAIEHKSVLAAASALKSRYGCELQVVPVDHEGRVSVATLEQALDDTVLAVSIMAVNNEIGTMQELSKLSAVVRAAGAIFHSDAAQAPLAMTMVGLGETTDLASLSGHKMHGPQGIGALYVRRDLQCRMEPIVYGGGQQNGLRAGTLPLALCVGMGAAAALLTSENAAQSTLKVQRLRDKFVDAMVHLPWFITLNGPQPEHRHPGNANLCFHGFSAQAILLALQPKLAASTGSACSSGIQAPSHVLKAIGLSDEDADASIRFSLDADTRDADVDRAIALVAGVLRRLSRTEVAA